MKEKLLISACLIGRNTKYNGGNNYNDKTQLLKEKYDFVIICPEMDGGLPCPRNPSEIRGDCVYMNDGTDVTKQFYDGAQKALELALKNGCKKALLKEKSPSCGSNMIYDGSFSGKTINGQGITTKILSNHGIEVYSELEIEKLL